jgi:hypothetical protein
MPSAGKHSLNFHTERYAHVASIPMKEKVMKARSKIALAMVGSFAQKRGPSPTRPIMMERKSDERIVEGKHAQ